MAKLWEIDLKFTKGFSLNFTVNNNILTATKILKNY